MQTVLSQQLLADILSMSTLDQRPGCPQPNLYLEFLRTSELSWMKPDDPKADSVNGDHRISGSEMLPKCSYRIAMWFTPVLHVDVLWYMVPYWYELHNNRT